MKDKIIKTSFWDYIFTLSSRVLNIPIQIITLALTTKILGAQGYGTLSLFCLISSFVVLFGACWTEGAITKYGREDYIKENKINKVFWGRNVILIPCLVVSFIGIIIFQDRILSYIDIPKWGIWLLIFYTGGNIIMNYLQYIQQAIGQLQLDALFKFLERLIVVVGLLIILLFFQGNLLTVIATYILSLVSISVIRSLFIKPKILLPIEFDKNSIKKIFYFSYPVIIASTSGYFINWIDVVVIKKYMTLSDIGIYSLSYRCMQGIQEILISLTGVLFFLLVTFLSEKREDLIIIIIKRVFSQVIILWSIFLSLIAFLSVYLIPLIFGNKFLESVSPFLILMLGLGIGCYTSFYSTVLLIYEFIKENTVINVLMALVKLVSSFLLVPKLGIDGAAIATLFSFLTGSILFLVIVNRQLKLNEYKQMSLIAPIFFTVLLLLFFHSFWIRILGVILIFIIFIVVIRRSNIFKKEDLAMFSKVEMPKVARNILNRTYAYLGG